MAVLVVTGVLLLVVGGCVCVVRAARGGPRWVRAVAAVTLTAGELVRAAGRSRGHAGGSPSGGGAGDA
ncbi:hypothetical protein ACIRFH_26870 [Streptomyces sp. NPDC093586]|uniref:hypothetical protein n=1 Tax=Streptomyces sp. NPDC093586 TaxID=3366042 RepID=UPI00381E70D9